MKQGKPVITFAMAAIAAALAVYFGFHLLDTFSDSFTTTLAYTYTAHDSVQADGLLVREEQVLPGREGIVEVARAEGERVGAGQTVALVYRDSQAQDDQAQLEALDLEIQLLEYAAAQGGDVTSAARLDEDILQAMVALRASAALGDFSRLEDQTMAVKSGVLKRGYTYGDGMTPAGLAARLRDLRSRRAGLESRAASATTRVTAGRSGVFSSLVDGLEEQLTPETVYQLTPAALSALVSGGSGNRPEAVGKLILSDRWYFAAVLPVASARRLEEGGTALLRFSGDFSQDVEMAVEHIGPAQGEERVAVFSSNRYLAQTTLLRRQSAELIFDSRSGLRVPKEALRMVEETRLDEESGQEVTESRLGVYTLVAGRAEFKPAQVVIEGEDYYILRPTGGGRQLLRAGDEVIVQATGLFQRQLLEY